MLTIKDFTKIIIYYILHHNSHPMSKLPNRDADIIASNIERTPLALWNWGIVNRTGRLRQVSDEKIKLALMIKDSATVTEKGIKFKNLNFTCSKAVEENWFSKSRMKGSWVCNIAYDPRNMDYIYLLLDSEQYEVCSRTDANNNIHVRCTYDDACFYQKHENQKEAQQEPKKLESKIDYKQKTTKIINNAEENAKVTDIVSLNKVNIKDTKENRKIEKEEMRKKEQFILDRSDGSISLTEHVPDSENFDVDYSNIIMIKQRKRNEKDKTNE